MAKSKTADESFQLWKDPRYIAADAKVNELKGQFTDVERQIDAENLAMAAEGATNRHLEAAKLLVHGGTSDPYRDKADMEELQETRKVLRFAIDLAERELDRVANVISCEICKRAKGPYLEIVRRLVSAGKVLAEVEAEENRFYFAMEDSGTRFVNFPRLCIGNNTAARLEALAASVKEDCGIDLN